MKRFAYALAFTALTAMPAMAQSASTDFVSQAQTGDYRASKFVGINIYGADQQKIGDINDVILGSDGRAKDVVIGVGGFLGIGEKNVAVPFGSVQWSNQPMQTNTAAVSTDAASSNAPAAGTNTGAMGTASGSMTPNNTTANAPMGNANDGTMSTAATTGTAAPGNPQATTSVAANNAAAADNAPKDYPDHGMVNLTKDQLQNAPAFKYASETR